MVSIEEFIIWGGGNVPVAFVQSLYLQSRSQDANTDYTKLRQDCQHAGVPALKLRLKFKVILQIKEIVGK